MAILHINLLQSDCQAALKQADYETKSLGAERNQWFTKYTQLNNELEERQRLLKADCQKRMVEKFREFVRDWNRDRGIYFIQSFLPSQQISSGAGCAQARGPIGSLRRPDNY